MELNELLKFVNEIRMCSFATVEDDQPRVRGMEIVSADETGLYFEMDDSKNTYKQLKANQKAEVCFIDPKSQNGDMVRISGKVEFLQDMDLKRKVIEQRPFLKMMGLSAESSRLIVFRLAKCQAHYWSKPTIMEPRKYLNFG